MACTQFSFRLLPPVKHDLVGVDDDHMITSIKMGGIDGLVLAAQNVGDLGREPTKDQPLGINDMPRNVLSRWPLLRW